MQRFVSAEQAVASAQGAQNTEGLVMSEHHVALALDVARGVVAPGLAVESIKREAQSRTETLPLTSKPPAGQ